MPDRTPFPVPEFDDATVAFGATRKAYLTQEQMGEEFYAGRRSNRYTEAAQSLFFNGGKLADFGLRFKPGIDSGKAMRAIKAPLRSFDPPHEIKIGTVGYALSEWCDDAPAETPAATPHQAQRKRSRTKSRRIRSAA